MIQRRTWLVLAALAFVVLAAVVWGRLAPSSGSDAGATSTPAPLWDVPAAAIARLQVEDGQGSVLLAAARDAQASWVLLDPVQGAADAGRLERAATWVRRPQVRGSLVATEPLAAYQLDPPRHVIVLVLQDGTERSFAVGRDAPTGGVVYAQAPGMADVLLISQAALDEVLSLLDPLPLEPTSAPP